MWGAFYMYNTTQLGCQTSETSSGMLSSLSGQGSFVSRKVILWGFFFFFATYFKVIVTTAVYMCCVPGLVDVTECTWGLKDNFV